MSQLIYLIEDDRALRRELSRILELSGYRVKAATEPFSRASACALEAAPDCVVVDLLLPEADGHAICREIRAASSVPIIVLTSSDNEFDEVLSMNLGADDYVTKPYRPAVLLARIQALLRRTSPAIETPTIEHAGVTLDLGAGSVSYCEKSAELTRNEQRILQVLMRNPGIVVPRSGLMVALWETDAFVDDNTLTVNVNRLRKTLASIGVPDNFLVTRRSMGYMI